MDFKSNLHTPLLRMFEEPPSSPASSVCMKLLTLILGIACITIGAIYLDSCTKQYMIPIYLIVSGSTTIFFLMISLIPCPPNDESNNSILLKIGRVCDRLELLFSIIWFIAGNVWIYSIYKPEYIDQSSPDYCNKTLYLFAFWTNTAIYIIFALMLFLGFCACLLGGTAWIRRSDG
ncbi:transmembrane protein 272-like [Scyliorhinus canicula]|uniref:transmembrane protein 272-like n=1 Tax=Scyliorhinus canicula TaxID=7830 RepID=UPI0018F5E17F|nr:transmembrane protein 272-like [Scyliorhinus canicula]